MKLSCGFYNPTLFIQRTKSALKALTLRFIVLIILRPSEMWPLSCCWYTEWTLLSDTSKCCNYPENGSHKEEVVRVAANPADRKAFVTFNSNGTQLQVTLFLYLSLLVGQKVRIWTWIRSMRVCCQWEEVGKFNMSSYIYNSPECKVTPHLWRIRSMFWRGCWNCKAISFMRDS